jgi:cupin 2 domain-containing protein
MSNRVQSIFADLPGPSKEECFLTLLETPAVKIERIVSHSHSSPPGFWYDQDEVEWVIVLRGTAKLEFEGGESIGMAAGDHLTIPSRLKHRVAQTDPETIWLAVHVRKPMP